MRYRIKEIRKNKKMTQKELAEHSNVAQSLIAQLESGRVEVTTTFTLIKLAKALDCKLNDLIDG